LFEAGRSKDHYHVWFAMKGSVSLATKRDAMLSIQRVANYSLQHFNVPSGLRMST